MTALLYRFREPLPFHNLPVIFLPVRVRHAQEIHAGAQVRDIDAGRVVRHCLHADQLAVNIEHLDSPNPELLFHGSSEYPSNK